MSKFDVSKFKEQETALEIDEMRKELLSHGEIIPTETFLETLRCLDKLKEDEKK